VIVTTHDLALAARADRLLLLGPEGLSGDGPPARVLHDEAAWARVGLVLPEWVQSKAVWDLQDPLEIALRPGSG